MAHAATISGLVANLIGSIAGAHADDPRWVKFADHASKTLRDHGHARTNQFAVKDKLDGLVEKFTVLNREDLADALQSRLDELPTSSKWLPEILALLLELSDRPVEKADLKSLELLRAPVEQYSEPTWDDIIAADPLTEDDIWDNVERGYHSSGDDSAADDDASNPAASTRATSLHGGDESALARLQLLATDDDVLIGLRHERAVIHQGTEVAGPPISELAMIREMLLMLRGLPTSLFTLRGPFQEVVVSSGGLLESTCKSTLRDLLTEAATLGTSLNWLRIWLRSTQRFAYVQSMQAEIQNNMTDLAMAINELEIRVLSPATQTAVSIIQVFADVQIHTSSMAELSHLITTGVLQDADGSRLGLLDALYEAACVVQASANTRSFRLLAGVLLAGLQTYLRLASSWISDATVTGKDMQVLFVATSETRCDLGAIWHDKFVVRRRPDDTFFAPRCLDNYVLEIFALGKNKYFVQKLQSAEGNATGQSGRVAFLPQIDSWVQAQQDDLVPFAQSLDEALRTWISSISAQSSPRLHASLLHEHGLHTTLMALPNVFFAKDGAAFQSFAQDLVVHLKDESSSERRGRSSLITVSAQETLGQLRHVVSDNLYAGNFERDMSLTTSRVRLLTDFTLGYRLSWPAQNITRCQSPNVHSKIFALLLQIFTAQSIMESSFLNLRDVTPKNVATLKLRQRLLWFAGVLLSHVTTAANEIHENYQQSMATSESIDEMVALWADYERRLQIALLLSPGLAPVRESILLILDLSESLLQIRGPTGAAGLLAEFEKNLSFLIAGVRGVSRAGAESWLEILADRLEWRSNTIPAS